MDSSKLDKSRLRAPGLQAESLRLRAIEPSPCTEACPAGINVKSYVSLIAEGRFTEALEVVREAVQHNDHIRGILAQKPLGMNFAEAKEIVELCQDAGITLAVTHIKPVTRQLYGPSASMPAAVSIQ